MEHWQTTVQQLQAALMRLQQSKGDVFSLEYQAVLAAMRAVEFARCAWRDAENCRRYGMAAVGASAATVPVTDLSAALTAELEAIRANAPVEEEYLPVSPRLQFARWLAKTGRISG